MRVDSLASIFGLCSCHSAGGPINLRVGGHHDTAVPHEPSHVPNGVGTPCWAWALSFQSGRSIQHTLCK
jgi:hypothetical protein